MQIVFISGNIGSDAQTITTPKGNKSYRFTVGVHNGKDGQGNNKTAWYTVFTSILPWLEGRLTKGTRVMVTGQLVPDIYVDREGKSTLDMTINSQFIEVLEPRQQAQPSQNGYNPQQGGYPNPVTAAGARYPQRPAAPQPTRPAAPVSNNNGDLPF